MCCPWLLVWLTFDAILQVYTAAKRAPEILLVSQFRPPLGRRCVELPAGLTDSGETPLDTALRELKEETGYTGACHGTSPVIAGEAGLTDNTLRVVRVHVDGSAKVNQKPTPRPDHEVCMRSIGAGASSWQHHSSPQVGHLAVLAQAVQASCSFWQCMPCAPLPGTKLQQLSAEAAHPDERIACLPRGSLSNSTCQAGKLDCRANRTRLLVHSVQVPGPINSQPWHINADALFKLSRICRRKC